MAAPSEGSGGGAGAKGAPARGRRSSGNRGRAPGERFVTDALLLRKVAYGEADLVVTFFTEERGVASAIARAARRSVKRFGALEPLHLLRVTLEERSGAELHQLVEAGLVRPRLGVLAHLHRIEAASTALQWVRKTSPARVREPALWRDINTLLEELDAGTDEAAARAHLAMMGLRLLSGAGWGLQLASCVRCGRECAPEATACIDAAQGGLVCRACGGARLVLRPARRRAFQAALEGEAATLSEEDAVCAVELVTATLAAHAGR